MATFAVNNRSVNTEALEDVSRDGKTFSLPQRPSDTALAKLSPAKRERYYRTTIEGIQGAQDASALTRFNLLLSRFPYAHAAREVDASLWLLHDAQAGPEAAINVVPGPATPAGVYEFSNPGLYTASGQAVNLPNGGAEHANFPAATRRTSRFYSFTVRINASLAHTGDVAVRQAARLQPNSFPVSIEMPTIAVTNAADPDDGFTVMHPAITADMLRDPGLLIRTVQTIVGHPLVLGILTRPHHGIQVTLDDRVFRRSFMEFYHRCRFACLKEVMRREFMGDNVVDPTATAATLQKTQQNFYDPETRRLCLRSVEEFYVAFTNVVNLFPRGAPYPVDVAAVFWSNLKTDIREQGLAQSPPYQYPLAFPLESPEQSDQRLRQVKEQALAFERAIAQIQRQVQVGQRGRGGSSATPGVRAFAITPAGEYEYHEGWDQAKETRSSFTRALPVSSQAFLAERFCASPTQADADPMLLASVQLCVFLSSAEEAIQKATGQLFPPMECWGCTNVAKYHGDRFHRWSECPYRSDPQVQANAKKALQDYMEKRMQRQRSFPQAQGGTTTSMGEWREQGHPSQRVAELVTLIAEPSTTIAMRQACYASLYKQKSHGKRALETAFQVSTPQLPNSEDPGAARQDPRTQSSASAVTPGSFLMFPCFIQGRNRIQVMNAAQVRPALRLNISQIMPHIAFPIGLNSEVHLKCMIDSCAGLSLARLSYHRSIQERFPQVVHDFKYIKDVEGMEEFEIGGINAKGEPCKVTAIITYKTPVRINGQNVLVTFALSEEAAVNQILGLPFIRAAKAAIFFDGTNEESLVLQRFGLSFKIDYSVPLRANQAPMVGQGAQAAFSASVRAMVVSTPTEVRENIEAVTRAFAKARLNPEETTDVPDGVVAGSSELEPNTQEVNGPQLVRTHWVSPDMAGKFTGDDDFSFVTKSGAW